MDILLFLLFLLVLKIACLVLGVVTVAMPAILLCHPDGQLRRRRWNTCCTCLRASARRSTSSRVL